MATIQTVLANGTTADANEVMSNEYEIYSNIDETNVGVANKSGSGKFLLQTSPTITSPTITGTIAGPLAFSGNITFDTNTLFVDAANNSVMIGRLVSNTIAATPLDVLSANSQLVTFESTSAGSSGPQIQLFHNSASPSSNDEIGFIDFYGKSSTAVTRIYANIVGQISDPTNASEDANLLFKTIVNGTFATRGGVFGDAFFIGRTSANAIGPASIDILNTSSRTALLESTSATNVGSLLTLYHNKSGGGSVNDFPGALQFYGNSTTSVVRQYGVIAPQILDPTNASEDSQLIFQTQAAGTIATRFTVGNTFVSTTTDFIIPSTNKLYFDGGSFNRIESPSSQTMKMYVKSSGASALEVFDFSTTGATTGSLDLGAGTTSLATTLTGLFRPSSDNNFTLGQSTSGGAGANLRWSQVNCMLIYTTAGVSWDMGGFTGGADVASNGFVTVTVNGVARKLMTTA